MRLEADDFRLVSLSRRLASMTRFLGDLENDLLSKKLDAVEIDRPIFLTGLARSGSTILLMVLSKAEGLATHQYRDFPFVDVPYVWNWYQSKFSKEKEPAERAHGDRIKVTGESPEAFEEPLWQSFFPTVHGGTTTHVLDEATANPKFEDYFRAHLKKIIAIRDGHRYMSKGNYNVTRIKYLSKLFPDAQFIIPVREPVAHVQSLVKQHKRFTEFAAEDPRIPVYLAAAGHYEFGPQRVPIHVIKDQIGTIEKAWAAGEEYRGYALQWAAIYGYVDALTRDPAVVDRVRVVRFEDMCAEPGRVVEDLLTATGLDNNADAVRDAVSMISAPKDEPVADADRETVWEAVGGVAERFGYAKA